MTPSKAQYLAAARAFYLAKTHAGTEQAHPVFRQHSRLCGPWRDLFVVELMPHLALRVRSKLGVLHVQSVAGSIEQLDPLAIPSAEGLQDDLLDRAVALFKHRTAPGCIYAPPLFARRLQPHDSGFTQTYTVELTAELRLRVRDRRTGHVHAQSFPGQLDRLDLGLVVLPTKRTCLL